MKKEKVFIKGFNSCSMRRAELAHYKRFLLAADHILVDRPEESTVCLIWTCGFRSDVAENTVTGIEELKRLAPSSRFISTGCLPDINGEFLKTHFDGDIIPWRKEPPLLEKAFQTEKGLFEATKNIFIEKARCENASDYRKRNPNADVLFHDEYCKILVSEGCPFNCAYCSEKKAFPEYHSFPPEQLIRECAPLLTGEETQKIVFIADCLGEYGKDIGTDLIQLISIFSQAYPKIKIALANLHPLHFMEFSNHIRRFILKEVIDHINLPIQSASDHLLKGMNRGYKKRDLLQIADELKRLNFTRFDTHLICGFPGETIETFTETIQFVTNWAPRYVLLSRYYHHPGAELPFDANLPASQSVSAWMKWAGCELGKANILSNIEGTQSVAERLRRLNAVEKRNSKPIQPSPDLNTQKKGGDDV